MLKFYVSVRPIQIQSSLLEPYDQLSSGFKGIDVAHKLVCCNRSIDGRYLVEVCIGSTQQYTDQQCLTYKEVIVEGLSAWSGHEKTLQSAKLLAESITGVSWSITEDGAIEPSV